MVISAIGVFGLVSHFDLLQFGRPVRADGSGVPRHDFGGGLCRRCCGAVFVRRVMLDIDFAELNEGFYNICRSARPSG